MSDKKKNTIIEGAFDKAFKVGQFVGKSAQKISETATPIAQKAAESARQGAEKISDGAKASAGKIKEVVDNIGAGKIREEGHTIIQLKESEIKILIPDGYTQLKPKKHVKELIAGATGPGVVYNKTVETSNNLIVLCPINSEQSMDFEDKQSVIDGIHEAHADNQGLIEVNAGKTLRGYDYIYSIVKTVGGETGDGFGVSYFLRMNLGYNEEIIEINAFFEECGTTGLREAMSTEFARRADLCSLGENGYEGWNIDPYNPKHTRGIPMNLAEKEGIDGLFPYNPLTQAREFIIAVIKDELVIIKQEEQVIDSCNEPSETTEEKTEEERKEEEREFCRELFVDRCRRYTYLVDIEGNTVTDDEKHEEDNELLSETVSEENDVLEEKTEKKKLKIFGKKASGEKKDIVRETDVIEKDSLDEYWNEKLFKVEGIENIPEEDGPVIKAIYEGKLAGTFVFKTVKKDNNVDYLILKRTDVIPEYRGKGITMRVMDAVGSNYHIKIRMEAMKTVGNKAMAEKILKKEYASEL